MSESTSTRKPKSKYPPGLLKNQDKFTNEQLIDIWDTVQRKISYVLDRRDSVKAAISLRFDPSVFLKRFENCSTREMERLVSSVIEKGTVELAASPTAVNEHLPQLNRDCIFNKCVKYLNNFIIHVRQKVLGVAKAKDLNAVTKEQKAKVLAYAAATGYVSARYLVRKGHAETEEDLLEIYPFEQDDIFQAFADDNCQLADETPATCKSTCMTKEASSVKSRLVDKRTEERRPADNGGDSPMVFARKKPRTAASKPKKYCSTTSEREAFQNITNEKIAVKKPTIRKNQSKKYKLSEDHEEDEDLYESDYIGVDGMSSTESDEGTSRALKMPGRKRLAQKRKVRS